MGTPGTVNQSQHQIGGVMGILKLGFSLLMLFLFLTVGKMNVQDDVIWLGLCVLFSAWVMHDTVDERVYVEKEDEEE